MSKGLCCMSCIATEPDSQPDNPESDSPDDPSENNGPIPKCGRGCGCFLGQSHSPTRGRGRG